MASIPTIILIVTLIFISVSVITVIQKREKARALLLQKVAQYRYRANEAANILSNFAQIPIGLESRTLLMQYIQLNLKAANQLMPSDAGITRSLNAISEQLSSPESSIDKQKLNIPKESEQLQIMVKHLSTLGKYLIKFQSIKAMKTQLIKPAIQHINTLISEAKICAFIQQGKMALQQHNYVSAQRSFQTSQQMLNRFTSKNERLKTLEIELKQLVNATPKEAAEKDLTFNNPENDSEQESGNVFGPKKKW